VAKWQPRVSMEIEASLQALGPYTVSRGGYLVWDPAPGFSWPWGTANLVFGVPLRNASETDYRRLLDAWRQVCSRQAGVLEAVRDAVWDSWEQVTGGKHGSDAEVSGLVRGGHFCIGITVSGQMYVEAYAPVVWDEEHGVRVDLVAVDKRLSGSFE
jgi:hypothetical protein